MNRLTLSQTLEATAIIACLLLCSPHAGAETAATTPPQAPAEPKLEGTIALSGAWALYPLAVQWGEQFQKLHPGVRFDISAGGAGKGMTDVLANAVDIGMVSRDISPIERDKGAFPFAMAIDAVVPVINAKNPLLEQLRTQGVPRNTFASIWIRQDVKTWNQIVSSRVRAPIRVYTRSDACGAAQTWAAYLGGNQEDLHGIGVYGDPGLGEAVRRDVLGIGYNNVNFAYDAETGLPVSGLSILPVDVNNNGRIDPAENFYATRSALIEAISKNLYPSPPARELYFVTKNIPQRPELRAFIQWTLSQGQEFVSANGYIHLSPETLQRGLNSLNPKP